MSSVNQHKLPRYAAPDPENYERRRKLMAEPPIALGEEWTSEAEAQCSLKDCPWKGPYLSGACLRLLHCLGQLDLALTLHDLKGSGFIQETAGCDPLGRNCNCLKAWGGKYVEDTGASS